MAITYSNTKQAVEARLNILKNKAPNPYKNYAKKIEESAPIREAVTIPTIGKEEVEKIPQKIPEKPVRSEGGSRKVSLTVFYSPEIIEFFKATGHGWQPRMNDVLLDYVRTQKHGKR